MYSMFINVLFAMYIANIYVLYIYMQYIHELVGVKFINKRQFDK